MRGRPFDVQELIVLRFLNWFARATYRQARRFVIVMIGGTIMLFGCIMVFTPGPGFAGILIGLGILAIEFEWARRWLGHAKDGARGAANYVSNGLGLQAKDESPHNAAVSNRNPASTGHAPE